MLVGPLTSLPETVHPPSGSTREMHTIYLPSSLASLAHLVVQDSLAACLAMPYFPLSVKEEPVLVLCIMVEPGRRLLFKTSYLEDLYKGTTKKMRISREIADVSGKTMQVEEILTIDVKPGWKKGTKITFAEKGNEQPGVTPADLVFIIDEKPHLVFTREGNDLTATQKISLVEALTGYTVNLTTLDGRRLTIPVTNVIHPDYEEVVPKEGMPLQKDPTKRGNLRIKFNIKFPTRRSEDRSEEVSWILFYPFWSICNSHVR